MHDADEEKEDPNYITVFLNGSHLAWYKMDGYISLYKLDIYDICLRICMDIYICMYAYMHGYIHMVRVLVSVAKREMH